jgi:F0F1-type ATP synthase assembly protein I
MYQSELCEAERRGRLVSSEPLFVGVGIEIAYWFDYGMSFVGGSIAWRLPIACQMVFAFVRGFSFLMVDVDARKRSLLEVRD